MTSQDYRSYDFINSTRNILLLSSFLHANNLICMAYRKNLENNNWRRN